MRTYKKPALTREQQIDTLKSRGLKFNNELRAENYLTNISFYRLRAYTYPFQDNGDPNHPFVKDISFEEIIALYVFDRRLRLLLLNAIEKIEVAMRTHIIYEYSLAHGSHWFEKSELFFNSNYHERNLDKIKDEIKRSNETFIKHYFDNYDTPETPPAWMTLEVISMGTLGKLFSNLKRDPLKKKVALSFGLKKAEHLENWMHAFGDLRNVCAHHGRVWNRRFPTLLFLPYDTKYPFIENTRIDNNKLYPLLCSINYIIRIIAPKSSFVSDMKSLLDNCPMADCSDMGFPGNWKEEGIWN